MIDSKELEKFKEFGAHVSSRGASCDFSMVAGTKFIVSRNILKHLKINMSEIKSARVELLLNANENKLLILRNNERGEGHLVAGTPSRSEIYCAEKCKEILDIMKRYLSGAGTVRFTKVDFDETVIGGKKTQLVIVDLNSFSANPGVLIEKEEMTNDK